MKLLIAIPALTEEAGIQHTIERWLEACGYIGTSPVMRVETTVVSDGSTDRTVKWASRRSDRLKLNVFPENRGYGAAIQQACSRRPRTTRGFAKDTQLTHNTRRAE